MLGWLDSSNFDLARSRSPCFSAWSNHLEFVCERDALLIGYGFAGVTAKYHKVTFLEFERWSRLTGAPLSLLGLDEFAAHRHWRAMHPDAQVIGRFGVLDNPERNAVCAGAAQCIRIRPDLYVRWRDEFLKSRLFEAPSLDAYAAHIAELSLFPDSDTRPPALSSP